MTAESQVETSQYALTAMQINALRLADRICYDHLQEPYFDGEGQAKKRAVGQIRAIKRLKNDPFNEEREVKIACISTVRAPFSLSSPQRDGLTCFEMLFGAQYDECWRTVVGLLRARDELELEWLPDNNEYLNRSRVTEKALEYDGSESLYQAGLGERLHCDKLYLHVRRGGKRKYSFFLDVCICPNNSARMIRGL